MAFKSDGGLALAFPRTVSWLVQGDPVSFQVTYAVRATLPDGTPGPRHTGVYTTSQKSGHVTVTVAGTYVIRINMVPRFDGDRARLELALGGSQVHRIQQLPAPGVGYGIFINFTLQPVPLAPGDEAPPAVEPGELPAPVVTPDLEPAPLNVGTQPLAPVTQDTLARTKYRVITPLRFVRDRDGALVQRQRYVSVRYLSPNNVASLTAQGYEIEFVDANTPESASAPYGPSVLARARDRRPGEARIRWDRQRGSRQRRTIQQIIAERYGGEYERAPAIRAPTRRVVR